jgi:lipooligosaccharide transport system permease protein
MRETLQLSWRVALRHWDVYRLNFWTNISPMVSDPAFMLVCLGIGLGAFVTDVEGMNYLEYLGPGLAIMAAFWSSVFETSYGFFVRNTFEKVYDAMLATPVGPDELIYGEFIWVALQGAVLATGVAAVMALFGVVDPTWLIFVPLVGGATALATGAIGMISSGLIRSITQFHPFFAVVVNPIFFFSAVFFPMDTMHWGFQIFAWANPFYHGVRLGQSLLWNDAILPTWAVHGPALLVSIFIFGSIARHLIRKKLVQ